MSARAEGPLPHAGCDEGALRHTGRDEGAFRSIGRHPARESTNSQWGLLRRPCRAENGGRRLREGPSCCARRSGYFRVSIGERPEGAPRDAGGPLRGPSRHHPPTGTQRRRAGLLLDRLAVSSSARYGVGVVAGAADVVAGAVVVAGASVDFVSEVESSRPMTQSGDSPSRPPTRPPTASSSPHCAAGSAVGGWSVCCWAGGGVAGSVVGGVVGGVVGSVGGVLGSVGGVEGSVGGVDGGADGVDGGAAGVLGGGTGGIAGPPAPSAIVGSAPGSVMSSTDTVPFL